jgi:hypothetical protein
MAHGRPMRPSMTGASQPAPLVVSDSDAPPGMFDESRRYGGFTLDPALDLATQVDLLVENLVRKLEEDRVNDDSKACSKAR